MIRVTLMSDVKDHAICTRALRLSWGPVGVSRYYTSNPLIVSCITIVTQTNEVSAYGKKTTVVVHKSQSSSFFRIRHSKKKRKRKLESAAVKAVRAQKKGPLSRDLHGALKH